MTDEQIIENLTTNSNLTNNSSDIRKGFEAGREFERASLLKDVSAIRFFHQNARLDVNGACLNAEELLKLFAAHAVAKDRERLRELFDKLDKLVIETSGADGLAAHVEIKEWLNK